MSQTTKTEILATIDRLHEEAANALAWANHVAKEKPWLRHDERIYKERAMVALQAAAHLMEEL